MLSLGRLNRRNDTKKLKRPFLTSITGFVSIANSQSSDRPVCEWLVGYPSGQRGQTVNLLAYAFIGSNPIPTTIF